MTIAVKIIFFRKMTNVNNDKKEINRKEKKEDILRFTLLFRIIDILVVRIIIVRINVSYKSLYFWCILSVIVIFIRLVISMICAWCANIYIRKLRRKTCRVSFINILVDIEIWFQIFQNFLRVAENAHRAPSPLSLLLSFFILILALAFSLIVYHIRSYRDFVTRWISSWRLYGSLKIARSRFLKFPPTCVWNFETRVNTNRIDTIVLRWYEVVLCYIISRVALMRNRKERKKERKRMEKRRRG